MVPDRVLDVLGYLAPPCAEGLGERIKVVLRHKHSATCKTRHFLRQGDVGRRMHVFDWRDALIYGKTRYERLRPFAPKRLFDLGRVDRDFVGALACRGVEHGLVEAICAGTL